MVISNTQEQAKKDEFIYFPEFEEEAKEILETYIQNYNLNPRRYGEIQLIMFKYMLHCESVGYHFTPQQRDYFIKTCMGIIPLDKEYEKKIGYFGQSVDG